MASNTRASKRKDSKEAKLFRKYSSKLTNAILNPVEIASELYANVIIDQTTRNKITKSQNRGAHELIVAVEAYIINQKLGKRITIVEKFQKVLDIFKQYIPLDSVVEAIEAEYYSDGDYEVTKGIIPQFTVIANEVLV